VAADDQALDLVGALEDLHVIGGAYLRLVPMFEIAHLNSHLADGQWWLFSIIFLALTEQQRNTWWVGERTSSCSTLPA
jgi:hypothetical protein